MTIPPACPKCGSRDVLVQVVTWAVYRDGKMEGLVLSDDVHPLAGGTVRCDDDACNWVADPTP